MDQTVITIGNFDGVHLGHAALLNRARAIADERHLRVTAMPFDPHPATVLSPENAPARLMTTAEKTATLTTCGVDEIELLKPTPQLLALEPDGFVQWLMKEHRPAVIVEGPDFHFGKGRAGNITTLRELGDRFGFETVIVEPVVVSLSDQLIAPVRSSLVRWLVEHGRVMDAMRCMGRPYELTAKVIKGEQRGRTINVPTANLDVASLGDKLIPLHGVYAGAVAIADTDNRATTLPAAVSIGMKPTFGTHQLSIEAHLLDFDGDLYDKTITIRLMRWLRDQQRFAEVKNLIAQIHRDVAQTRQYHEQGLIGFGVYNTSSAIVHAE